MTSSLPTPEFVSGAWHCADKLMQWLNEQDTITINKADVYRWAMAYRPPKE